MLAQRLQFIKLFTRPAAAGFGACLEIADRHDIAYLDRIELDLLKRQFDDALASLAVDLLDGIDGTLLRRWVGDAFEQLGDVARDLTLLFRHCRPPWGTSAGTQYVRAQYRPGLRLSADAR